MDHKVQSKKLTLEKLKRFIIRDYIPEVTKDSARLKYLSVL